MSSKGIDYYGFKSVPETDITFSHPADGKAKLTHVDKVATIVHDNVQVDGHDLSKGQSAGRFSWRATATGQELASRYADINPTTGNLEGSDMGDFLQTPSVIAPDYAVSYGFYDAGTGTLGLTSQDQTYVYVTENYATWMGDLVATEPRLHTTPFNRFVLAGAHDAGMYDPQALGTVCADRKATATMLSDVTKSWLGQQALMGLGGVLTALSPEQVTRGLINLAFTQKDSVSTMLELGIRYFDFRPGTCPTGVTEVCPGIYHQHNMVPGVAYDVFLRELLTWLRDHPTEIVVLALGFAGFAQDGMKPAADTLAQAMWQAQEATGMQALQLGDKNSLPLAYGELLARNYRLLLLNLDADLPDYCPARKYDSYDLNGERYHTAAAKGVLKALTAMDPRAQQDPASAYDYTVFQLQGTVTATTGGTVGAVSSISAATSPLLSTKPGFDRATYPWVQEHLQWFSHTMLTVLLNDFADNALVYYAREQTLARLAG